MTKRGTKHSSPAAANPSGAVLNSLRSRHLLLLGVALIVVFFNQIIFKISFFWEDFLYQFYPFQTFALTALRHGQLPLWNPYTFCGMPFAADITGAVYYLPHLLLLPWVSGDRLNAWAFEMFNVLHFVLALVAMFACARQFGLHRIPAAFSALVYSLSGFMITHTIHIVMITQAAWFPLAVMLFKKSLEKRSIVAMIVCGFILSMIICSGHPQISLYLLVFLFAFFVFETVHRCRELLAQGAGFPTVFILRQAMIAAVIVGIGLGLAAVQLIPTSELAGLSIREDFSFARTTEGELHWPQLLTIVIPKFFGSSNALGRDNPTPFWGPEAAWAYWETCIYIGIPALILAIFAARRFRENRYIAFLAGFTIFALLYALGDNFFLHGFFYNYVPGFNRFRVMGRWGFFVSFSGALLAGLGIQSLVSGGDRSKLFPRILLGVAAIPAIVLIMLKAHLLDGFILDQIRTGALHYDSPAAVLPLISDIAANQSWISLAVALLSGLALYLLWKRSWSLTVVLVLVFVAQFIDMFIFGYSQNNGTVNPETYFHGQAQLIEKIKQEGKSEYFRVNGRNGGSILIDRNQGMMDRIFLADGYTQLALLRRFPPAPDLDAMYRLMNTRYRVYIDTILTSGQRRLHLRFDTDSAYLPRAFFVYRDRIFTSPEEESAWMSSRAFNPRNIVALEADPGYHPDDSTSSPSWKATIESYDLNAMTLNVSTQQRGILVLSEIFYPGWNVSIDGKQSALYRADWSLRAVVVEAGEHSIELRYEPASFRLGAIVSMSTLGMCGAGLLFSLWRTRRTRTVPKEFP